MQSVVLLHATYVVLGVCCARDKRTRGSCAWYIGHHDTPAINISSRKTEQAAALRRHQIQDALSPSTVKDDARLCPAGSMATTVIRNTRYV